MKNKIRIRNPRDFWAGMMFTGIGTLFAVVAWGYKLGTAARMGPGFFPFWLGLLLIGLGLAISFAALRVDGMPLEKFHWRPVLWVLLPIVGFGLLLKITGVMLAGFLLVIAASYGGPEFKWRGSIVLALGLVIFCSLVFVAGLKLPIPLCPGFDFFDQFALCRV